MLEIYISNISVDLPKEIQIAITVENPLMLEDRIPAPYSLNFDLPATPKNKRLFGYPDRLGGYGILNNLSKKNRPCVIRFQGINILKGHVIFLQFLNDIKLQFVGVDYNEYLKAPMNTLDLGRKYFLGSYNSVDYSNSNNFAWHYARWAEELASGSRGDMVAGPIVLADKNMPFSNFEEDMKGYGTFDIQYGFYRNKAPFQAQDNEYINQYNAYNGTFMLEPESDPDQPRLIYRSHASIFPMFRVGYLFDVIFGNILLNNPFTEGHLFNLVMPTFYFSQWKRREHTDVVIDYGAKTNYPPMVSNPRPTPSSPYPDEPYIELNDFLPSTDSNVFIRSQLNLFCMTMAATDGKLTIKSNNSIMLSTPQKNWTDKVMDNLDFRIESGKQYLYGFSNAKKDNINTSDAITVPSRYEMMNYPFTLDENGLYEQLFIVQDQVILKTVQEVEIKHLNGNLNETQTTYSLLDNGFSFSMEKENKDTFEMTSDIIPLPLYPAIFFKSIDNTSFSHPDYSGRLKEWLVPGIKELDRSVRPSEIHLTFHKGVRSIKDDGDKNYPSFSGNLEASTTSPNILSWEGQYGLFNTYHKSFAEWIGKEKLLMNSNVKLNVVDLKQLDILEKIHIKGRNFFIKKMQYTIGTNSLSSVNIDFIEA
ncbi:hypothetical protein [Sphingobacterium mizutaii]|uniref:hypothetical protein n=1 Tax=Sphingobacterium mizutaii TaxID=1010 RepID=UPI003D956FC7